MPKPSIAHRHNQHPLQKKHSRITFDTKPKSNEQKQETSKKNLPSKRPQHQEKYDNPQESYKNKSQAFKQQNRVPEESLKRSSDEQSRKYTKNSTSRVVSSKSVHESSLKSSQAPQVKRIFSSMSDGHVPESLNRESKMRKLENIPENVPTNQEIMPNISPQESLTMNVLNVKMTLLSPLSTSNDPYELFHTQNSSKSSSSENLSQEEIFNFNHEVNSGNRPDFSNTAELINAV